MRTDGYAVHSYEFPFMVDEKKAGSSLLRRLLGITDVPADHQVLMLYTSFFRTFGNVFLWNYAGDAESVAVGVTGGGVEIEGVRYPPPLSWEELSRDLLLASRHCRDIHIFSLEGCVRQGFLERLPDFDWDLPIQPPRFRAGILQALRIALRVLLWVSSRPAALVGILICVIGLFLV
jgi:hypothetical protein